MVFITLLKRFCCSSQTSVNRINFNFFLLEMFKTKKSPSMNSLPIEMRQTKLSELALKAL